MYKQCSFDASLVVRVCTTLIGVKKTRKIMVIICYLQACALIWQFQICIDHPISIHSISHDIELHCLSNYLLL